jgi:hypothetical protein
MIFIPGIVITILTFPGYVMKSVATKFWCDVLGVPVYEVKYFKGTILHEKIEGAAKGVLVALSSFTVNTSLCAILLFPVAFLWFLGAHADGPEQVITSLLAWVGISVGMHALPARSEMEFYLNGIPENLRRGLSYSILCAAAALFTVTDILKRFWLALAYAFAVGLAVPFAITSLYLKIAG